MSPAYRLDRQIDELSRGRLRYDPRRSLLTRLDPEGQVQHEIDISETALRGLMQRLLLAAPQPLDDEPLAVAVRLLLAHLDEET